jgi:LuxR family maltose regulon positive regulatory protein
MTPRRNSARLEGWQIPRPRIIDEVIDRLPKLTLFVAPAGFGKTTAMLECHARLNNDDVLAAWLTLDDSYNDPAHLAGRLMEVLDGAIRRDAPNFGLLSRYSSQGEFLASLLDVVGRIERPIVLFLDELDALQPPAMEVVREIVHRSGPALHIVVGSRSMPSLNRVVLRLRGQLIEIGAQELRFRPDEMAELASMALTDPLPQDELETLIHRTEGWAAALQLACLAMRSRPTDTSFSSLFAAVEDNLADYLAEEVFVRQTEAIQQFLLATSCLDRLTGALANAVMGRDDGDGVLRELERDGLFLSRVDVKDDVSWYAYHQLFARFLRRRLAEAAPDKVREIQRRAMDWFASQEMTLEAAKAALQAGDADEAGTMLSRAAMDYVTQGQFSSIIHWVELVSVETAKRHPLLFVAYIWAVTYSEEPSGAEALIEYVEKNMEFFSTELPVVEGMMAAVRIIGAARMDQMELVRREGPAILDELSDEDGFHYGGLAVALAHAFVSVGEWARARKLLALSETSLNRSGKLFGRVSFQLIEGIARLSEVRIPEAIAELRNGYDEACRRSGPFSHGSSILAGPLATALYEQNALGPAQELIDTHLPLIAEIGLPDVMACGYITAIRLAYQRHDHVEALRLVREGELKGSARNLPRITSVMRWEAARMAALRGDLEEAARIEGMVARLDEVGCGATTWQPTDLPPLWLELWRGNLNGLLPKLEYLHQGAQKKGQKLRLLQLKLLYASALQLKGRMDEATTYAAEALLSGLRGGMIRIFVDHGPATAAIVRASEAKLLSRLQPAEADTILLNLGILREALKSAEEALSVPGKPIWTDPTLEALTQRETEILECLQHGLTNKELAEALQLSETTVKWHLRNIFGKLNVDNRTEAVFIAREARLIPDALYRTAAVSV